jgi:hypothetical protein
MATRNNIHFMRGGPPWTASRRPRSTDLAWLGAALVSGPTAFEFGQQAHYDDGGRSWVVTAKENSTPNPAVERP